jgi:heterodisulfide reductase subunit A-like polyferredoxin
LHQAEVSETVAKATPAAAKAVEVVRETKESVIPAAVDTAYAGVKLRGTRAKADEVRSPFSVCIHAHVCVYEAGYGLRHGGGMQM